MSEPLSEQKTQHKNCPVCGGELDSALHCISCGRDIRLTEKTASRRFPIALIFFIAILVFLLLYSSWRYYLAGPREFDGFVMVEKGVDDSKVYVATEEYKDYSSNLAVLRRMRLNKLELEREKTKILGDIGEERRIERLILNLNNGMQELTERLKMMEHISPDPKESRSP